MYVPYNRESFFLHIRDAHRTGADPHHVNTMQIRNRFFFSVQFLKLVLCLKCEPKTVYITESTYKFKIAHGRVQCHGGSGSAKMMRIRPWVRNTTVYRQHARWVHDTM